MAGASEVLVKGCACMSVRNRYTIKIHGFMHKLQTLLPCATHGAITTEDLDD